MQAVLLSRDEVAEGHRLAMAHFEYWKGWPGNYGNDYRQHLAGYLGKIGAEKWLRDHGHVVTPLYRLPFPSCDRLPNLILDGHKVSVKSWWEKYWKHRGRAIEVLHHGRLMKRCDRVVWAVVQQDESIVSLHGWNDLHADFDVEPVPLKFEGHLHLQLAPEQLRSMKEFTHAHR